MDQTRFPSKRDAWLSAVIWLAVGACVVGGVAQLSSPLNPLAKVLVLVSLLAGAGFMLWVLYDTRYTVSPDALDIQSGPFRWHVPLIEIDSAEPSSNPLSSPACSLDRLLIRYRVGRRRILVSPEDKVAFLDALVRRGSHLVRQGDRVTRRGGARLE